MQQILSPGRWRGLKTTSRREHVFTVLAFDQRENYRRMLPQGVTYEQAAQIKQEVGQALSFHSSAVLLDPNYGLKAALNLSGSSGLLLALEKSGYSGDSTYRHTEFMDGWTIGKIKQMGASAAKLLIYYHPDSGALAEETEALVKRVAEECHQHDLPLFVEPLSYSLDTATLKDKLASDRPRVVRETARRLSKLGTDVMKMEFPLDAAFNTDRKAWHAECESISANCDVPWALLSAGVDFETFAEQVRIACIAGASGFVGGRAIWKEAVTMTPAERQEFLTAIAVPRLTTLTEIAVKHARPWTDFYAPIDAKENWFLDYPEAAAIH